MTTPSAHRPRSRRLWVQLDLVALPHLADLVKAHPAAARCFLHLLALAGRRNTLAITTAQLAERVGIANDTAQTALSALVRLGYICRLPDLGRSAMALNAAITWLDHRDHLPLAPFCDPRPFPPPARATRTVPVPTLPDPAAHRA